MVRIEKFENALDVDNEIYSFDINVVCYTQYFHNQQALKYTLFDTLFECKCLEIICVVLSLSAVQRFKKICLKKHFQALEESNKII